jgi:hypothetical protein
MTTVLVRFREKDSRGDFEGEMAIMIGKDAS